MLSCFPYPRVRSVHRGIHFPAEGLGGSLREDDVGVLLKVRQLAALQQHLRRRLMSRQPSARLALRATHQTVNQRRETSKGRCSRLCHNKNHHQHHHHVVRPFSNQSTFGLMHFRRQKCSTAAKKAQIEKTTQLPQRKATSVFFFRRAIGAASSAAVRPPAPVDSASPWTSHAASRLLLLPKIRQVPVS